MKLYILVVLYKQSPELSETINSLSKCLTDQIEGNLHIWDNSPKNAIESENLNIKIQNFVTDYSWHPENTPLSVIYNKTASQIGQNEYMIILDQDSKLPPEFLIEMRSAAEINPEVKLFLPKVHNGEKLVSPGKLFLFKGHHLKHITHGKISSKNMLAISSGMMISSQYLSKNSFDERLALYGIDTRFMIDFARKEDHLSVVPTTISHDTALWSTSDPDKLLPRFRALIRTWPIVFEDKQLTKLASTFYGYVLRLKMTIKYRDLRFLLLK